MEAELKLQKKSKGVSTMPSADECCAEVLGNHCHLLEWRVNEGHGPHMGIFRLQDIPFVFQVSWKERGGAFHIEVWHVRPRSTKKVVDRIINT